MAQALVQQNKERIQYLRNEYQKRQVLALREQIAGTSTWLSFILDVLSCVLPEDPNSVCRSPGAAAPNSQAGDPKSGQDRALESRDSEANP